MPIEAGQQLLHYRLVEQIGEGGMGAVWRALDIDRGDRERSVERNVRGEMVAPDIIRDGDTSPDP